MSLRYWECQQPQHNNNNNNNNNCLKVTHLDVIPAIGTNSFSLILITSVELYPQTVFVCIHYNKGWVVMRLHVVHATYVDL